MTETTMDVRWTDPGGNSQVTHLVVHTNPSADRSQPAVILLHGHGGTIHHMADPFEDFFPGFPLNFLIDGPPPPRTIDRGWHGYPNATLWGLIYPPQAADGLAACVGPVGLHERQLRAD
jgi:predicted esterase